MIFHRKTHSNTITTATTTNTITISKEVLNIETSTIIINPVNSATTTTAILRTKADEVHSTTPATTRVEKINIANLDKAKEKKAKKAVVVVAAAAAAAAIKATKTRVTRSRRSTQTTITSEEGNLSNDDTNSVLSTSCVVKTTQKTTTPVSKANSEELRQRLLADWSDEDNVVADENKTKKEPIADAANDKRKKEKREKSSTTATAVVADIVETKTTVQQITTNNVTDDNSKMQTRIRNIPKKDRRDVILTEFKSEDITEATTMEQQDGNGSGGSNSIDTVIALDATKTTVHNDITTINRKETTKMSCFDFREDDEDSQQNALKSIANFKKTLLLNTNEKSANTNEEESSEKFNKLTAEIDNLLEQSFATVADAAAIQRLNSVESKDELTAAAVKSLPIKERGKRIFKSRNRTHSSLEQLASKQNDEDGFKNVCKETDELLIPRVQHSPIEIFRCITPTHIQVVADDDDGVRECGSSSISEADAEFGSPTSMLDDDRLPFVTCKTLEEHEAEQNVHSEQEDDEDEEEIESPPHEELSGNELEAEIKRVHNKNSTIKSAKQSRTPTPKKQLKEIEEKGTSNIRHSSKTAHNETKAQKSMQEKQLSKQTADVNSSEQTSTVPQMRKRRGHMKITPCRTTTTTEKLAIKENVIAIKDEETDIIVASKRHKSNENSTKEVEVLLERTKTPINVQESSECSKEIKSIDNGSAEDTIKRCEIVMRKTKLTQQQQQIEADNIDKVQKTQHNLENATTNNDVCATTIITTTNNILNNENVTQQLQQEQLLQTPDEVQEQSSNEAADIKETINEQKITNNKKLQNDNYNNTTTLAMKRKHGETIKLTATKVRRTNGSDIVTTLNNNNNNNNNALENVTPSLTTANGECKQATNTIVAKLDNNRNNEIETTANKAKDEADIKLCSQVSKTLSKEQQKQEVINTSTKIKTVKNQTAAVKDACEQLEKPVAKDDEQTLNNEAEEEEELPQPNLTTFSVDEAQILEMQSEEVGGKYCQ